MSAFTLIYPTQRTLLGDIGLAPMYSTGQLDLGIRAGLLEDATSSAATTYYEDPDNAGQILPDFPAGQAGRVDQYRLAIRAALALVRPSMGVKSSKTPVVQINRNQAEVIAELKHQLALCTAENVVVGGDSDADIWINGFLNFLTKMQSGI